MLCALAFACSRVEVGKEFRAKLELDWGRENRFCRRKSNLFSSLSFLLLLSSPSCLIFSFSFWLQKERDEFFKFRLHSSKRTTLLSQFLSSCVFCHFDYDDSFFSYYLLHLLFIFSSLNNIFFQFQLLFPYFCQQNHTLPSNLPPPVTNLWTPFSPRQRASEQLFEKFDKTFLVTPELGSRGSKSRFWNWTFRSSWTEWNQRTTQLFIAVTRWERERDKIAVLRWRHLMDSWQSINV